MRPDIIQDLFPEMMQMAISTHGTISTVFILSYAEEGQAFSVKFLIDRELNRFLLFNRRMVYLSLLCCMHLLKECFSILGQY
jgi:hypothetical protein